MWLKIDVKLLGGDEMIYITGDTHRNFYRLHDIEKSKNNMIIILGDSGINYCLNEEDRRIKEYLNSLSIKLFCIQGNHEERPENILSYKEKEMFGGKVFVEEKYPNLIFAKNGELYNIDNKKVLVIGGAYSVDKEYRLLYGHNWFKDEQLSDEEQNYILNKYKGKKVDIILSHTCPLKYEPTEVFMQGIDQTKVDKTTEIFLDKIEENVNYDKWYCGHYHTEKKIDKLEFMFGRIKVFNKDEFVPKHGYNNYEIIRDSFDKKKVSLSSKLHCPICDSKNVILLKGNGQNIYGDDSIGIICDNCKKIYGFNDVKYKPNCPKEL